MRFHALATDYDGTLATHGKVDEPTLAALQRLLASGRKLILVTGRELPDLTATFPRLDLFESVVAENGALLYRPRTREEKVLAGPPPEPFLAALRARGVQPLAVGRVIVATREPHEKAVLDAIHELGLELQVIFNKGAVMVLPSGVNKATGLAAALKELGLSPHNVVGVGDAENDHAFLRLCGCSVAVANALLALKQAVDWVTSGDHGAGVRELIGELVGRDLAAHTGGLRRDALLLGTAADGGEVRLPAFGTNVLIAGPSGSGKSMAATSFLERLVEGRYQFCLIDPEGDYETFEGAITLGTSERGPAVDEILHVLAKPRDNAVVNLIGLPLADRPAFFQTLLPRLLELRARLGRPHWLVLDETHHLLPATWQPAGQTFPAECNGLLCITVHPEQVAPALLARLNVAVAVGGSPDETLRRFCKARGDCPPDLGPTNLEPGEVAVWSAVTGPAPVRVRVVPARSEHRRHTRKYAVGELPPDRSFYFRGPEGKLNLRAQNLLLFLQLADGVDDDTWMYHLRQGDYARWFREGIKDDALAADAARVEGMKAVSPQESRALIRRAVEQRYTQPAAVPLSTSEVEAVRDRGEHSPSPRARPLL
jgi:hydroxymethylpyrimidine pyrophosphatase-like HAD family hydrolase